MTLGTVHLKSGRGAGRFEGRVMKFLTSFFGGGGLKFRTPVLGDYDFIT